MIFLCMGLGVLVGLFFGEMVAFLDVVGEVWIKLLQMTVLPYVMVSLIIGLGSLNYSEALLLARKGSVMLLLLWGVTLIVVFLFPFTFPDWESSSFFSTAMTEKKAEVDFLGLYIPDNLFYSLANNLVPAVVLFSIAIGVALIGVEKKDTALESMGIFLDALTRIANFVVRLTPIGVFAIMASAAGTLSFEEVQRLEVYIYSYIAISLVMSLWVLPGLVTTLTPLRYRDVVGNTKDALVTAFATGSLFVVLPILVEKSKELITRYAEDSKTGESAVEVIVPASFNFPHAGKLFTLSFVLFAGWFSGYEVETSDYPVLIGSGIASLFANVNIAVPFMLDLVHVPEDMFQLFITTGVINARFATLLSAMFTLTLTLLGAFSMCGLLKVSLKDVLRYIVLTVLLLAFTVGGLRTLFSLTMENAYAKDQIISSMQLKETMVPETVYRSQPPAAELSPEGTRLDAIVERGFLRACYLEDNIPFSYINNAGELVGLDIEYLHILAFDLKVSLELVPTSLISMNQHLNEGYCDIGSSQLMTPEGALNGSYSSPIMYSTFALLVKDHKRADYALKATIWKLEAPRIGIQPLPYYIDLVKRILPQGQLTTIESPGTFINEYSDELDAMLLTAEAASAWSLLYPQYAAVIPKPVTRKVPVAFPLPQNEESLADFLNIWLELKKHDGSIQKSYDHWVLGKQDETRVPRWSVIRDVLHWVD